MVGDENYDGDDGDEGGTQIAGRPLLSDKGMGQEQAYMIVLAGNNVGETFQVKPTMVIGRASDADIRVVDDGVSRKHARVLVDSTTIIVEDLNSRNGTFVNGERIERRVLKDGDKIEVGSTTILKFTFHDKLEEEFQQKMFDAALRDSLTKAFNKRFLEERLTAELSFSLRHGTPLSLLMFDIDKFKVINDTHGHLCGDYVLTALSKEVQKAIRKEDIFARYGGEEFALLCRGTDLDTATATAERLREIIEKTPFNFGGLAIAVTTSVGVSGTPDSRVTDITSMIGLADKALYDAKHAGRNRVIVNRGDGRDATRSSYRVKG